MWLIPLDPGALLDGCARDGRELFAWVRGHPPLWSARHVLVVVASCSRGATGCTLRRDHENHQAFARGRGHDRPHVANLHHHFFVVLLSLSLLASACTGAWRFSATPI